MRFENVADDAVANAHLNKITQMFNSTGEGVQLWNKLDPIERSVLCKFAGLDEHFANDPIQNFHPIELRRLRAGTKRLEKLATRFNHISLLDFK